MHVDVLLRHVRSCARRKLSLYASYTGVTSDGTIIDLSKVLPLVFATLLYSIGQRPKAKQVIPMIR